MTPDYFTQKVKVNFPEIYNKERENNNLLYKSVDTKQKFFNLQVLCELLICDHIGHGEFVDIIKVEDPLYADGSYNRRREIELDFLYKYIQDNIDLIHFRLL